MKTQAIVVTLWLAGSPAMAAPGAEGWMAAFSDASSVAGKPAMRLAGLSEEEMAFLRKQWRALPPDERERLRQKLRDERVMPSPERFGQGFEYRRPEAGEVGDQEPRMPWGKPRPDDRFRQDDGSRR